MMNGPEDNITLDQGDATRIGQSSVQVEGGQSLGLFGAEPVPLIEWSQTLAPLVQRHE